MLLQVIRIRIMKNAFHTQDFVCDLDFFIEGIFLDLFKEIISNLKDYDQNMLLTFFPIKSFMSPPAPPRSNPIQKQ
jgi:hypothetical protein